VVAVAVERTLQELQEEPEELVVVELVEIQVQVLQEL
jgi:hypothetical protein